MKKGNYNKRNNKNNKFNQSKTKEIEEALNNQRKKLKESEVLIDNNDSSNNNIPILKGYQYDVNTDRYYKNNDKSAPVSRKKDNNTRSVTCTNINRSVMNYLNQYQISNNILHHNNFKRCGENLLIKSLKLKENRFTYESAEPFNNLTFIDNDIMIYSNNDHLLWENSYNRAQLVYSNTRIVSLAWNSNRSDVALILTQTNNTTSSISNTCKYFITLYSTNKNWELPDSGDIYYIFWDNNNSSFIYICSQFNLLKYNIESNTFLSCFHANSCSGLLSYVHGPKSFISCYREDNSFKSSPVIMKPMPNNNNVYSIGIMNGSVLIYDERLRSKVLTSSCSKSTTNYIGKMNYRIDHLIPMNDGNRVIVQDIVGNINIFDNRFPNSVNQMISYDKNYNKYENRRFWLSDNEMFIVSSYDYYKRIDSSNDDLSIGIWNLNDYSSQPARICQLSENSCITNIYDPNMYQFTKENKQWFKVADRYSSSKITSDCKIWNGLVGVHMNSNHGNALIAMNDNIL